MSTCCVHTLAIFDHPGIVEQSGNARSGFGNRPVLKCASVTCRISSSLSIACASQLPSPCSHTQCINSHKASRNGRTTASCPWIIVRPSFAWTRSFSATSGSSSASLMNMVRSSPCVTDRFLRYSGFWLRPCDTHVFFSVTFTGAKLIECIIF